MQGEIGSSSLICFFSLLIIYLQGVHNEIQVDVYSTTLNIFKYIYIHVQDGVQDGHCEELKLLISHL